MRAELRTSRCTPLAGLADFTGKAGLAAAAVALEEGTAAVAAAAALEDATCAGQQARL